MTKRRGLTALGLVAVLVAALSIVSRPSGTSAHQRLERARQGIKAGGAWHFTASVVLTGAGPDGSRLDADVTGRGDLTGRKAHSQWTEPGGLYEEVLLGESIYSRWAGDEGALDGARWRLGAVGHDQGTGRSLGARALFEAGAGAPNLGLASPANLSRLLGEVRLQGGSGHTVNGTVPFDRLFADGAATARDGTATVALTAGDGGSLERMVWTVTGQVPQPTGNLLGGDFKLTADVRFADGRDEVAITAPPGDQVDRPGDEARHHFDYEPSSVNQVQEFPVLAPTHLPAGFRLVGASVVPADDRRCTKVALHWEDPAQWRDWLASDHLRASPNDIDLREYRAACLGEIAGPGIPFHAGDYQGTIALPFEEYDYSTVYLTLGDTHMVIKSDLPVEELRTVVASIKPWDLAQQPLDQG